jgi:hypothetical protein
MSQTTNSNQTPTKQHSEPESTQQDASADQSNYPSANLQMNNILSMMDEAPMLGSPVDPNGLGGGPNSSQKPPYGSQMPINSQPGFPMNMQGIPNWQNQ